MASPHPLYIYKLYTHLLWGTSEHVHHLSATRRMVATNKLAEELRQPHGRFIDYLNTLGRMDLIEIVHRQIGSFVCDVQVPEGLRAKPGADQVD